MKTQKPLPPPPPPPTYSVARIESKQHEVPRGEPAVNIKDMGLRYSMYVLDSKKKVTIPYDDEMKTYIEIKFVQVIHKTDQPITKKIFAAVPCPSDWDPNGMTKAGDVLKTNHICPENFDKIIL
jgi:hypothetical protein